MSEPTLPTTLLARDLPLDPTAVRDALATAFEVQLGRRQSVRVQRLDTFDRRLAGAGLVLERRDSVAGGDELVLVDGSAGGAELKAGADGLALPALATDLPAGPLRERLSRVMGIRALLVVSDERRHRRSVDLRNSDTKVVARLTLDEPDRVQVTPLRGYAVESRRVVRALEALGLQTPEAPASPPRRHVEPPADPGDPATAYVAGVLTGFLDTMQENLPGLLDDVDTEFLHDFRVAVRRTRSTLKLGRPALPDDLRAAWEPTFKWLGDLTTPVRDLDVYTLDLPTMADWLVAAAPQDLRPFEAHLHRRRARERRALVRGLRSARYQDLERDWRVRLARLETDPPPTSATADDLARRAVRRSARRVLRQGEAVTAESPGDDLHSLRKRCKEMRYALEVFSPLLDAAARKPLVSDLKRLQDVLGRFQDTEVQRAALRSFAEEMMSDGTAAEAVLAMGELIGHLDSAQQDARREFDEAFSRLARPASRRRLESLVTPG